MNRSRVLLTSVYGPYARDDSDGSRRLNPMELYHNQVTRLQGPFSLRMFHRSWGLMMIQSNLETPCTVLDFPDLDRFTAEIRDHDYDVVGISAIATNLEKTRRMCELVRRFLPDAIIVVGGHVTGIADLAERIDADHLVRGEGIRWFREFLGEDVERPLRHPEILSGIGTRAFGTELKERPGDVAATLIPSVGCPLACNFCSTSAMFGGRGRFVRFFETAEDLFDVMVALEESMKVQSFFVMDENFLLDRRRALRLLALMRAHDKAWSLYVFSSANALERYRTEELVGLGVSWVWMGLEGEASRYRKLDGVDTLALTRRLRDHGIKVLGSTIIGLENHSPANIDRVIDHAVRHATDFHQFMLYMPMPGTPLHEQMSGQGRMIGQDRFPYADSHGQTGFNYHHSHIPAGEEEALLVRAFRRDFAQNGPSIARIIRTMLRGYRRYAYDPDPRIRRRMRFESRPLATTYAAVMGACVRHYRNDPVLRDRMRTIRDDLLAEFGWRARIMACVGGLYLTATIRREAARLAHAWSYEPPTFFEKNRAAMEIGDDGAKPCRQVDGTGETRVPLPALATAGAD